MKEINFSFHLGLFTLGSLQHRFFGRPFASSPWSRSSCSFFLVWFQSKFGCIPCVCLCLLSATPVLLSILLHPALWGADTPVWTTSVVFLALWLLAGIGHWGTLRSQRKGRERLDVSFPCLWQSMLGHHWLLILWLGCRSFQGVPFHVILFWGSGNHFLSCPFGSADVHSSCFSLTVFMMLWHLGPCGSKERVRLSLP